MKKALLVLLVFGPLGAVATAGGFGVSFGYSDCGRSYYRPSCRSSYYRPFYGSHHYYRPSHYSSYYRPSYRSHHYYRSYSHCYRPSVVYVPRIRYCR